MPGIRLRSDSTGSMKSAFYQGTITYAPNPEDEAQPLMRRTTPSTTERPHRQQTHFDNREPGGIRKKARDRSPLPYFPFSAHYPPVTNPGTREEYNVAYLDPGIQEQSTLPSWNSEEDVLSFDFSDTSKENEGLGGPGKSVLLPRSGLPERSAYPLGPLPTSWPLPPRTPQENAKRTIKNELALPPGQPSQEATHGFQGALQYQLHPTYGTTDHITSGSPILKSSVGGESLSLSEDWDDQSHNSESLLEFMDHSEFSSLAGKTTSNLGAAWTLSRFIRTTLYNPSYPEFTSVQQFSWAVILGILMGVFTAVWKALIELCVEFTWKTTPEFLFKLGVFTPLDGAFPIYHYMWIVPGIFGGILSYVFAALPTPIPGQNEWIHNLHSQGVQSSDTFVSLFILSTAGMASGLSLGPELPLILTAGMIGSWLGVWCKQSMLQARVLNLTAASAAIGGFFGFPMAGALFVLEAPHRMGLQYFEALSPATISSIAAVLTNRLVTGNDVTGYYEYPFLNQTLPSSIFTDAILFGLFGGAVGIVYTKVVLALKVRSHKLFQGPQHDDVEPSASQESAVMGPDEETPLRSRDNPPGGWFDGSVPIMQWFVCTIPDHATRAGMSGAVIGVVVGITCMFVPHVMFWGESQLQNLIDKGRTPLPVFGRGNDASAGLTALGFCMSDDGKDEYSSVGFSIGCSALIAVAKMWVTGLSLGTGIVGGHFWAPLFVGCAASHFLTDLVGTMSSMMGISLGLSAYPCVALLCIMGSCHVVIFRAHMAIILILTLTIDAFDPQDETGGRFKVAGDYSAVFPLLTVAVFVALQVSRHTVFYEKQRSRGDIMALPEVLCEPGKEGSPLVMDYERNDLGFGSFSVFGSETDSRSSPHRDSYPSFDSATTEDIEAQYSSSQPTGKERYGKGGIMREDQNMNSDPLVQDSSNSPSDGSSRRHLPPRPEENTMVKQKGHLVAVRNARSETKEQIVEQTPRRLPSAKTLDEYLSIPLEPRATKGGRMHRRSRSEPLDEDDIQHRINVLYEPGGMPDRLCESSSSTTNGTTISLGNSGVALKRVSSFGQVRQEQPSLLDQARRRAASLSTAESPRRPRQQSIGHANEWQTRKSAME